MPEFQLTDSILTSLNAQEPWPDNVKLFQPYEVEQILLPDNASCLAVQAFLKMCNLPFEVEMRWNAEFMSPSGRVPFIKCGAFVVSELEPIVQFAANKGVTLCAKLSSEEKAEMRAYMSLITNVLVNAELYISWIDDNTYNAVTKVRNSSVYPWPLGWLQTRAKRNAVAKRLKALNWGDKTLDQVLADVEQCCNSLSQRLGERDYFFGTTPTPLDALVYGHIRALLSAIGPKAALFMKPLTTSLLKHVVRMVNITGMKLTFPVSLCFAMTINKAQGQTLRTAGIDLTTSCFSHGQLYVALSRAQEDYLLSQAFSFTRMRLCAERTASERHTRIKRSRLCIQAGSRENLTYKHSRENVTHKHSRENVTFNKEIIGFKPFAVKQVVITTAKDGTVTCKYEESPQHKHSTATFKIEDKENYAFAVEFIEDVIDKVEEIAFNHLNVKFEEKTDFEIVYSQDDKFANITIKMNEYLDTIEENEITDTTISLELPEDMVHVTRLNDDDNSNNDITDHGHDDPSMDDDEDPGMINDHGMGDTNMINSDILDSDELGNDKHLEDNKSNETGKDTFLLDSDIDSSNNKAMKEEYLTVTSSIISKESDKTDIPTSSDSTLKFPSDENISVEGLLKYIRERNATYGHNIGYSLFVADID